MSLPKKTYNFDTALRSLAILIGFFMPISTALTNILCPLAFLLILAEGQYKQKFNTLRYHPVAIFAMLIFVLMLLGVFYTSVSLYEAGRVLDKYREFLYIPFFLLIFRDNTSRKWGLYAFLAAMGITLFISYLMAITGWHIGKALPENPEAPYIFKNYITQSFLLALAAYFVAVLAWQDRRWLWLKAIVILLIIYNIMFLSEGRTGYLILYCLILLFFYQTYRVRGILFGVVVLATLSLLAYNYSDALQDRINKISTGVQNYQQVEVNTYSSVEMRLEFYENSLALIAQNPLLGTGTGSFAYEYKKLAERKGINPTANPHNEYLMMAVQWGLIGVGLFVFLLYIMWRIASRLADRQSVLMAQGLIVTIVVGCSVNSFWLDSTEGHIFAYLIGVFYGGLTLTSSTQSLIKLEMKSYIKSLIALVIAIVLALIAYRVFLVEPSVTIDSRLAKIMMKTINDLPDEGKTPDKSAIALDVKGASSAVTTQFQPIIKSDKGVIGNKLKLLMSDKVTISTYIIVDPLHVGKAGHVVIVASYQPPTPNQTTPIFFQQSSQNVWKALDINQLNAAQSFSELPDSIDLQIYKGGLVAGQINVFVAYVVEDKEIESLIFNLNPIRFTIVAK